MRILLEITEADKFGRLYHDLLRLVDIEFNQFVHMRWPHKTDNLLRWRDVAVRWADAALSVAGRRVFVCRAPLSFVGHCLPGGALLNTVARCRGRGFWRNRLREDEIRGDSVLSGTGRE